MLIEEIRLSRVKACSLFSMCENDLITNQSNDNFDLDMENNWEEESSNENSIKEIYSVCDYYLNIADQLIAYPEGVVPSPLSDREIFQLLSNFYLESGSKSTNNRDNLIDESKSKQQDSFAWV